MTVLDFEPEGPNVPPRITDPVSQEPGIPPQIFISTFSQGELATVTAIDSPGDTLEFRLFGEDANLFDLNPVTGVLSLNQPVPGPTGSFDNDSIYELTVLVQDSAGETDVLEIELPLFTAA